MKTRFKTCFGPDLRNVASLQEVLRPATHLLAHQKGHHVFRTKWGEKSLTAPVAWAEPQHRNTSSLPIYREIEKRVKKRENEGKIKKRYRGGVSKRRASVTRAENGH